jgi:hypothetical protein
MKALILTNEYPPNVYGGAGVHVDYLTRELSKLMPLEVRCFGNQDIINRNFEVKGFEIDKKCFENCPKELESALAACSSKPLRGSQNSCVYHRITKPY